MSLRNSLMRFDSVQGYQKAPQGAIFICGLKMSDEKDFDLRDKFALEIVGALIAGDPSFESGKSSGYDYDKIRHGTAVSLVANFNCTYNKSKEEAINKMEAIARTAYKMADILRKVRLTAFE